MKESNKEEKQCLIMTLLSEIYKKPKSRNKNLRNSQLKPKVKKLRTKI